MHETPQTSTRELIFGIHPVLETLNAGKEIETVLVQRDVRNPQLLEIQQLCKTLSVPMQLVPLEKMNRVTRKNHQGVIAFMSAIQYASLDHIISECYRQGKNPFILVLDRVTDVRNFGGIVRTAECAGVDAIVVPERGKARIGGDAFKTSAGALSRVPICREKNLKDAIRFLKNNGLQVIACTEKAAFPLYKVDFTEPTAILAGSEEDGIQPEHLQQADLLAKIPLMGKIESLNVSVAVGVMLYEAVRQKIGQ